MCICGVKNKIGDIFSSASEATILFTLSTQKESIRGRKNPPIGKKCMSFKLYTRIPWPSASSPGLGQPLPRIPSRNTGPTTITPHTLQDHGLPNSSLGTLTMPNISSTYLQAFVIKHCEIIASNSLRHGTQLKQRSSYPSVTDMRPVSSISSI